MKYGDKVKVLCGEHKGQEGKVEADLINAGLCVVEFEDGTQEAFEAHEIVKVKEMKTVKLEMTEDELNMLVEKLSWMRCVVRDSYLDHRHYCNGQCENKCDRPELHNFENWIRSKIIAE